MSSRPESPTDGAGGGGGDARTAQKLLRPRRRRQIEIWLDEAVHWGRLQNCAVGKSFGHLPADLSRPPPPPPTSKTPLPSSAHQEPNVSRPRPPPPCQVCGRYFTGEEGEQQQPLPTTTTTTAPSSSTAPPGRQRDMNGKPGRTRQLLQGVMSALGITEGDKRGGDDGVWDPAMSTRMFLVEATTTTTTNDGAGSDSSAASRSGSDGGKQALDERMARLRRAQRLLEKSQPKVVG